MKTILSKMRVVAVALACVMLGVLFFVDANGEVKANENITFTVPESTDACAYATYSTDEAKAIVQACLTNNTAPQVSEAAGYLFAGWYKDELCTLENAVTAYDENVTTYYAKFVPEGLLGVKAQLSPQKNLRFVSSIDGLAYSRIGFILEKDGKTYSNDTKDVFKRIEAKTEGNEYTYSPKVVDTDSEYFVTAIWNNVQDTDTFYVRAYFKTLDGVEVVGPSRYVSASHDNANYINLPVKGLTATTDSTVEVSATNLPEGITVTATVLKKATNEDVYAHVLITLAGGTNKDLKSVTTFDFGDGVTAKYRNLFTSYNGSNADDSWYEAYKDTENEFIVATSADFYGMDSVITDTFEGKTIYLVSDIVANDVTVTDNEDGTKHYGWTAEEPHNWSPLASSTNPFAGRFDGQGHTIKGLYHSSTDQYVGLFAATSSTSTVKNFNLTDSQIIKQDNSQKAYYLGSVVGQGYGTYEDIYSNATVQGAITENEKTQCIGGIVGVAYKDEINCTNCHYAGNISTASKYIGGIVGMLRSDQSDGSSTLYDNITNCIFSGRIATTNSEPYLGGICGYVNRIRGCDITDCVSVGTLQYSSGASKTYIGSVVGCESDDKSSYAFTLTIDGTVTNATLPQVGANGDSIADPKLYSGADFDLSWYDMSPRGYVISDAADLYGVYLLSLAGETFAGDTIRLGDDIELDGTSETANWTPIPEFAGTLDGDGHTISGIHVAVTANYAGVFAKVSGATIKNLRIEDSMFTSSKNYIAVIAGDGYGTFEQIHIASNVSISTTGTGAAGILARATDGASSFKQCWNAGSVTVSGSRKYCAGGLVGRADKKVTIENCLNSGTIDGNDKSAGGFIGWIYSDTGHEIRNSVNTGTIEATKQTGALFGLIDDASVTIEHCYNKSNIERLSTNDKNAILTYKNDEKLDFINVTNLETEPFTNLESSVWNIEEGTTPTLKCFE